DASDLFLTDRAHRSPVISPEDPCKFLMVLPVSAGYSPGPQLFNTDLGCTAAAASVRCRLRFRTAQRLPTSLVLRRPAAESARASKDLGVTDPSRLAALAPLGRREICNNS